MNDEEWVDPFRYQEVRGSKRPDLSWVEFTRGLRDQNAQKLIDGLTDGPEPPPPNRPEPEFDSVFGSGPRPDSIMSTLVVFAVIACSLFAIGLAWLLICWVPYS
jgi:hypothetical protein